MATTTNSTTAQNDVRPGGDARNVDQAGRLTRVQPAILLAFRVVIAVLFVLHPVNVLGLLDGSNPGTAMAALSLVEILLIALVAVGLYARQAAFLLSGMMAFAFFVIHLPGGWNWMENGGETPALYCWVFLLLFVLGPGPLSLDQRRAASRADKGAGR